MSDINEKSQEVAFENALPESNAAEDSAPYEEKKTVRKRKPKSESDSEIEIVSEGEDVVEAVKKPKAKKLKSEDEAIGEDEIKTNGDGDDIGQQGGSDSQSASEGRSESEDSNSGWEGEGERPRRNREEGGEYRRRDSFDSRDSRGGRRDDRGRRENVGFVMHDETSMIRISKKIADLGYCSRRDAEDLVSSGKVKVNGVVTTDLAFKASFEDEIDVSGKKLVNKIIPLKLYALHKPKGYITSNIDPEGRPTIFDIIPEKLGRLITIGRLDFNTEGLLLLTNNGDFARYMELPASNIAREYRVRVMGEVDMEKMKSLADGIEIDGTYYGKVFVSDDGKDDAASGVNSWLRVKIFEGKNREVRNIMEHFGLEVSRLIRVKFGSYELADIPAGCVVEIKIAPHNLSSGEGGERRSFDRPRGNFGGGDRSRGGFGGYRGGGERRSFGDPRRESGEGYQGGGERRNFDGGDRPRSSFGGRPSIGGFSRPRRESGEGYQGGGERRSFDGGDRPRSSFGGDRPRTGGFGGPRRESGEGYQGGGERRNFDGGERPRSSFGGRPRTGGFGGPRRESGEGYQGGGERRNFDGGDRPRSSFGGDRPRTGGFGGPRGGGERRSFGGSSGPIRSFNSGGDRRPPR